MPRKYYNDLLHMSDTVLGTVRDEMVKNAIYSNSFGSLWQT